MLTQFFTILQNNLELGRLQRWAEIALGIVFLHSPKSYDVAECSCKALAWGVLKVYAVTSGVRRKCHWSKHLAVQRGHWSVTTGRWVRRVFFFVWVLTLIGYLQCHTRVMVKWGCSHFAAMQGSIFMKTKDTIRFKCKLGVQRDST
jgi:hypothetical protein